MRTSLSRPLVAATLAGLTLVAAAPVGAAGTSHSASYAVKAGAKAGTSEAARDIADVRRVAVAAPRGGRLKVAVRVDDVPAKASRIDGVYSVELEFGGGDVQTISYATDTVVVGGGLVVAGGLLELDAEAEVTLTRREVEVSGEGCADWTATADHGSDTVVFEARGCVGLDLVDEVRVEGMAVTTADKRVGYDASGRLRHDVHLR